MHIYMVRMHVFIYTVAYEVEAGLKLIQEINELKKKAMRDTSDGISGSATSKGTSKRKKKW